MEMQPIVSEAIGDRNTGAVGPRQIGGQYNNPEINPELIIRARKGDIAAFNDLILATQDVVYQQAYWLMHHESEAEDATQEAFLRAFQKLESFRGGSFKSWIVRITTNVCLDELRRQKRHPAIPLEPVNDHDEEIEDAHWMGDPGDLPEEQAIKAEKSSTIYRCIRRLPLEYQTVLILVDLQDFDYQEAAIILKVPIGTIKSRLTRARLKLRKQFKTVHFQ
jgi:RNA polymerase sigma-70 factor (ECF subfamily)